MTDLDTAIDAGNISVRWVGGCWLWCCRRHGNEVTWLGTYPADDPAGRAEVAEHLAEHDAFDNQPRQIARRAILDVLAKPKFLSDQELADVVLDAAWDAVAPPVIAPDSIRHTVRSLIPPAESNGAVPKDAGVGQMPDKVVHAVLNALDSADVSATWNEGVAIARAAIEAWEAHCNAEMARQAAEEWGDPRFLPADPTAVGM